MLIDDSNVDNFIHQKIIQQVNLSEKTEVYTSAKSALLFLKEIELQNGWHLDIVPGIIFLDINMPGMNGIEFLKEFECITKDHKHSIKIITLSSTVNPDDIELFSNKKCVCGFIDKPLTAEKLLDVVEKKLLR